MTTTALSQLQDDWAERGDDGDQPIGTMIDMSLAFDIVNHKLLLINMRLYGFGEGTVQWFASYLSQIMQKVMSGGQQGRPQCLEAGVPQGGIMGLLLHNIFTDELSEVIH